MRTPIHRLYDDVSKFERLLSVYFYTSNTDKLLQARLIFARNGYSLRNFTIGREPYDEDYSLPTEEMLTKALRQVNAAYNVRSIFFVEDTSLRIEALSNEVDFPGLQVKEWFNKTSFAEVDRQIKLRGGNRMAAVRSDIALYVPNLAKPLFFHGETRGVIADTPPRFEPSFQYPWLTPKTFNGWIIPTGANRRLGEMEFEESLNFDFRAKSLLALIERLGQLNAALNVPSNFYSVRRSEAIAITEQPLLTGLLPAERSSQKLLLVVGHKCAGKTTFSDHLAAKFGVVPIEASNVLRMLAWQLDETLDGHAGALAFLQKHGLDCVARRIVETLLSTDAPYQVVTGLRTAEELLLFKRRHPSAEVILVETDPRIRFERHIRRARDKEVQTFKEFVQQDETQSQFGLMRVAHEVASHVISNDGTPLQYQRKISELLEQLGVNQRMEKRPLSEMHKCLSALKRLGRAATCDLIAKETEQLFENGVRRYNTNRALKSIPEFATRSKRKGNLLAYRLNDRGSKLLELLDLTARGQSRDP